MRPVTFLVAVAVIGFGINSTSYAQGTVDMAKLTCDEFLKGSANAIEGAIWLSGYYNGLRKNTKLNYDSFKNNADAVVAECRDNPKNTVMQTVNTILSRKK